MASKPPSEMCPECEGYEGCDAAPGVEPDDEGFCGLCHGTGYLTPNAISQADERK